MKPTPTWDAKAQLWRLDLRRPWNLGRHTYHGPPPPLGAADAIHWAYGCLAEAERERGPEVLSGQMCLPGAVGRTLAQTIGQYLAERKWRRSRRWTTSTLARVVAELGDRELAAFGPPAGAKVLWAWRDHVRRNGYDRNCGGTVRHVAVGPRAMLDRLNLLGRVLKWAASPPRCWIAAVPPLPDPRLDEEVDAGTKIHRAVGTWVEEAIFRKVRDAIYSSEMGRGNLRKLAEGWNLGESVTVEDYVARRRFYLSFAFYTGMREEDIDEIDASSVSLDLVWYRHHGRKTESVRVEDPGTWEKMPDPLRLDLEDEMRRLGRRWHEGEKICGGPWKNVHRVLRAACALVGVPGFTMMTIRRSFAVHKAMRGVEQDVVRRLMGHKSSRMLDYVYRQFPTAREREESAAAWPEMRESPAAGNAKVISLSTARKPTVLMPIPTHAPSQDCHEIAKTDKKGDPK